MSVNLNYKIEETLKLWVEADCVRIMFKIVFFWRLFHNIGTTKLVDSHCFNWSCQFNEFLIFFETPQVQSKNKMFQRWKINHFPASPALHFRQEKCSEIYLQSRCEGFQGGKVDRKWYNGLTCSGECAGSWATYSWHSSGSSPPRYRWRYWTGHSWPWWSGWSPPPRTGWRAPPPRRCSQSWWRSEAPLQQDSSSESGQYQHWCQAAVYNPHLQLPLLLHQDLGLEAGHGVPGLTGAGRPPRHTGELVSICLGESDLLVMREHQARDAVLDIELAGRSEENEQEWTGIVIHLKLNNSK